MLKVVVLHKIIMRLLLDLIFLLQMIVTTNDCGIKPRLTVIAVVSSGYTL